MPHSVARKEPEMTNSFGVADPGDPFRRPPWYMKPGSNLPAKTGGSGRGAPISSPSPPRPCGASSSTTHDAGERSVTAAVWSGSTLMTRPCKSLRPVAMKTKQLAVHEALDRLAAHHARKAELVNLRYFVGMTIEQAAEVLGILESPA